MILVPIATRPTFETSSMLTRYPTPILSSTMGFRILLVTVLLCFIKPIEVHGFVSKSRAFILTDLSGPSCSSSAGNLQNDILSSRRNQPLSGPSLSTITGAASSTRLSSSSSPSSATSDVRRVVDWIMDKPLESLISKKETIAISREWMGDEALVDSLEQAVIENWDKIVQKLTKSSEGNRRTLSGLLGEEATQRLLRGVQNLDIYSDSKTVNAFLQSDAVNDLFAQTLCKYFQ